MAQTIVLLCDFCLADDRSTTAATHDVKIDDEAFQVDACVPCAATRLGSLRDELARIARRVKPTQTQRVGARGGAADRQCLICAYSGSRAGLDSHRIRAHRGISSTEMFGTVCPMCGADFFRVQSLAVHGERKHQAEHLSGLFVLAAKEGDPHGIVAKQREAALTITAS